MLTPEQLNAIDQHIHRYLHKTKWFRQEEFVAEITDHYVDSILARMHQGDPFEMALTNTYNSFGQAEGLKRLELNYWKLSSREYRKKIVHRTLTYFTIPRVFISLPLIGLFFFVRTQLILPLSIWFPISLFGQNILSLFSWLFRKRSHYFGPLQPFIQRIANPFHRVKNWVFFIFLVEMFSSSDIVGKASPYLATFLYAVGVLFYLCTYDLGKPTIVGKQVK